MTNELAELGADVERGEAAEAEELEALLKPFVETRNVKTGFETSIKEWSDRLKEWFRLHPDQRLTDGEHGIEAFMQTKRGPPEYDLISIHEKDPVLFERLLKTGCLRVDAASVKAQGIQVSGVERYASPRPETLALQVIQRG